MKNFKYDCLKTWIIASILFTLFYIVCLCFTNTNDVSIDVPFNYLDSITRQQYLNSLTPKYPPPLFNFTTNSSKLIPDNIPVSLDDVVRFNQ